MLKVYPESIAKKLVEVIYTEGTLKKIHSQKLINHEPQAFKSQIKRHTCEFYPDKTLLVNSLYTKNTNIKA